MSACVFHTVTLLSKWGMDIFLKLDTKSCIFTLKAFKNRPEIIIII